MLRLVRIVSTALLASAVGCAMGAVGDDAGDPSSRDAARETSTRADVATDNTPAPPDTALPDGPAPPDPCTALSTCAACTPVNGCGWCNGRCVPGTSAGPSSGAPCASGWAWLPAECTTTPPPPPPDVTCVRNCAGRACGPDGCGGACGACAAGQTCTAAGTCTASCTRMCAGRACGPDGCGGTCGSCPAGATCTAAGTCMATCTRNCAGRACGPDGCGGTCGACAAGQVCTAAGTCMASCTPMCAGRTCGANGCGGTCGTCPAGFACTASGTCAECTEGATQCVAGNVAQVRRCVGGRWTVAACGSFQLCTLGACRAVCEEVVPVATGAVVCAVPNADGVNNGVYWVTNDTARLPLARLAAGVFDYGGTVPARIISAAGRTWPWAWQSNGPGTIVFPLNAFARPVGRVAMRVAARRAYVTASITRHFVGFNNGSGVFAAVPNPPESITSSTWTPYFAFITSSGTPSTSGFNYTTTGGNSVNYGFTGDGFGGVWDSMQLNWMFLQID